MCGIFAAIGARCGWARSAIDLMSHRGPDTFGVVHVDLPWASTTLGMSRLKIVDQSDLTVPFSFPHIGVVIAFNGEIYNWKELQRGLDVQWRTSCDAEVVAALWRAHGPQCLDLLNGMWGFVLVDTLKHEVFVARDRAGEKPIYYARRDGKVYISSELKALPVSLTEAPCMDVNVLEFDCMESLPVWEALRLEPGSYLHFKSMDATPTRWWSLPADVDEEMTYEEAVDSTQELLTDAIRIRYVSERPVAVQLSGGLDSAIVQAVCDCDRLYCVTFDEVDNLTMAKVAARGHEVVPVTFTLDDISEMSSIVYHLDTPATWTALCQWFMNRRIADDGNVVVMSGEGADELFGGYSRYRILHHLDRMGADEHLVAYGQLIERTFRQTQRGLLAQMLDRGGSLFHAETLVNRFSSPDQTLVAAMARVDFYTTMQVLLRMADRMAAAFSLENRSPFFDYRLMELSAKIPSRFKVTDKESKAVLRDVARRLGVPLCIVEEKTKKGLFIPKSWSPKNSWDRSWFKDMMRAAWSRELLGREPPCQTCSNS